MMTRAQIAYCHQIVTAYRGFLASGPEFRLMADPLDTMATVTKQQARERLDALLNHWINGRGKLFDHCVNAKVPGRVTRWRHIDSRSEFIGDRNALISLSYRVRVYRFNTRKVRERFGHLLSKHDD